MHERKDLKKFLVSEERDMFPQSSYYKFIAHPFAAGDISPKRMKQYMNNNDNNIDKDKKMVIVIGPEGGNYNHHHHYCHLLFHHHF